MENLIYGNEPTDLKLLALRLIKKIHLWFLVIILGALAGSGIYYLATVTFAEEARYQTSNDLYFLPCQVKSGCGVCIL